MAVNDILEVRFASMCDGQLGLNVRHYEITAEVLGGATLQEIADGLDAIFSPLVRPLMHNTALWWGTGARHFRPLPISTEFSCIANQGAGNIAGDRMPRQVAGLISLRTAQAGRSGRGRLYIPFPGEASNDIDGTPTLAWNTLAQTLATAVKATQTIVGAGTSTTLKPVVWSRAQNQRYAILTTLVRTNWATQRRRGSFGAPNAPPF